MPYVRIATSAPIPDTQAFLKRLSITVAELLGKSESYVMTELRPESPMTFGGSNEACAFVELMSLGMDPGTHSATTKGITEFISEEIGVLSNRIYIKFEAPQRSHFAWDGRTFGGG